MNILTKFHIPVAAAAIAAATLGASAAVAVGADSATAATTTTASPAATSGWDPAAIAPADGAAIKSGKPNFKWKLPATDQYSTSYILVTEARNSRITTAGKLVNTSTGGEGVGDTLSWPKSQYLWAKDDGSSPLLAGRYLWQIQANDQTTGAPDDMPIRSFTVPGWIKLGHLVPQISLDPSNGTYTIQFTGALLGNINNADSMHAHPNDPRAQFVCPSTGTFKLGRRTVLVVHEKEDCSSAVAEWGRVTFSIRNGQLKVPAGAHLSAELTVSGDGVTVKSNVMHFVQP